MSTGAGVLSVERHGFDIPVLGTDRLILRGLRPDDFDSSLAMATNPTVMRYIGGAPLSEEEVWARLLRTIGHWFVLGYGFWAVAERSTGRHIGDVGFLNLKRDIEPGLNGAPEIGWAFDPSVHGRGYASEAVGAAIAWGEDRFDCGRTVCIIHPDNAPSLHLAKKFGYRAYARSTYKDAPTILLERI